MVAARQWPLLLETPSIATRYYNFLLKYLFERKTRDHVNRCMFCSQKVRILEFRARFCCLICLLLTLVWTYGVKTKNVCMCMHKQRWQRQILATMSSTFTPAAVTLALFIAVLLIDCDSVEISVYSVSCATRSH